MIEYNDSLEQWTVVISGIIFFMGDTKRSCEEYLSN